MFVEIDYSSPTSFAPSQHHPTTLRTPCENPSDISDCLSKFRAVSEGKTEASNFHILYYLFHHFYTFINTLWSNVWNRIYSYFYTCKLIQCVARWFSLIISVEKLKLYSNCNLSNLFFLTNNNRIPFLCLVIQLQPVKQLRGRRWVSGVQPGQLHFLSRVLCHFRHDQLNM